SEIGEGGSPLGELTSQHPNLIEQGIPHEQLVASFRCLIVEQQSLYQLLRAPNEREVLPPEAIIRKQLDWHADTPNKEQAEIFHTLGYAWDALAFDRYEQGSGEEGLAGSTLQAYYSGTK